MLKFDNYEYLGWKSLDCSEDPILILGLEYNTHYSKQKTAEECKPKFKKDREWHPIYHQSAGLMCHHHCIWASPLVVTEEVQERFREFDKLYYDSCIGFPDSTIEDLLKVRKSYKEILKADCNFSYRGIEEAFYPIDFDYFNKLVDPSVEKQSYISLSDILEENKLGEENWIGILTPRPQLILLTENSD